MGFRVDSDKMTHQMCVQYCTELGKDLAGIQ